MDDVTSPSPTDPRDPAAHARLDALEARVAEGVITRSVTVVDAEGHARIHLDAHRGHAAVALLDADGHERVRLTAEGGHGHVVVRARAPGAGTDPTWVDLFALDAEDGDDRPSAGVELVDRGTSAAGLVLSEGRPPCLWTEPLL